jgi:hypothetical protein
MTKNNYRSSVFHPFPSLLVLGSVILLSQTALAQTNTSRFNDAEQALQRYQARLQELESAHGPYHESLIEPLQSMEELLFEQGQFEELAALQNRRLQVLRTTLGFEHLDQIPLLEEKITTALRLRQWQEIGDQLEHIHHLQVVNFGAGSEQALAAMDDLATWKLARIYLDEEADRPDLVLDVREIYEQALDIVEDQVPGQSLELIPWQYKRSLSLYYLVAFMNNDDGLAGETIQDVIKRDGMSRLHSYRADAFVTGLRPGGLDRRTPIVEQGDPVGIAYLRQALGYINKIKATAEQVEDLELQAIAELYHGDYQVLMSRSSGQNSYRRARELFVEAGISEQRVDALLAQPIPIPLQQFHLSFDSLEAQQRSMLEAVEPAAEDSEEIHIGVFEAWEEDLPAVALPNRVPEALQFQIESNAVELEFRINSRGETSAIDVIQSWPEERAHERVAWRALRDIRFRPAFIDNKTRSTRNARLRYQFHVVEEQ